MTGTSGSRVFSWVTAVLGPLLVLGVAYRVFNHREENTRSSTAIEMEEKLSRTPPDIVVVGNSTAPRAIQGTRLVEVLGEPGLNLVDLSVAGSGAATWYAVLKHRVFANEYGPDLVLIPSFYEFMVSTGSYGNDARITDQLATDDPIILRKSFHLATGSPLLFHLEQRRDRLREDLFSWLRNVMVGVFFGQGEGTASERGEQVAMEALTRVFSAEGAVDLTLHRRAVPIVEEERTVVSEEMRDDLKDTYIPDIVEMAQANGAHVVFVLLPVPSMNRRYLSGDAIRKQRLVSQLNALGAGWIDLSNLGVPDSAFMDNVHLNGVGGRVSTDEIGRRLLAMNAMHGESLPASLLPVAPSKVERVGELPVLASPSSMKRVPGTACGWRAVFPETRLFGDDAAAGLGLTAILPVSFWLDGEPLRVDAERAKVGDQCDGTYRFLRGTVLFTRPEAEPPGAEARNPELRLIEEFPTFSKQERRVWWVYPGTTARFSMNGEWTPEMGEFQSRVVALTMGGGEVSATFSADGGRAVPLVGPSRWVQASLAGGAPVGSQWTLDVHSPSDGPFLLLRVVSVGAGPDTSFVLGSPSDELGPRLGFVGVKKNPSVAFFHDGAPPPLPQGEVSVHRKVGRIPLPGYDFLRAASLLAAIDNVRCDPIQLLVDGAVVDEAVGECGPVRRGVSGAWCHAEGEIQFVSDLGDSPTTSGKTRTLGLDPKRECMGARWHWLYPGDRVTAQHSRAKMVIGADQVYVRGHQVPETGADGPLTIAVRVGEETIFKTETRFSDLAKGVSFDLPVRIPPETMDPSIELSSPPDAAWFVIHTLSLAEGRMFEDLPVWGEGVEESQSP